MRARPAVLQDSDLSAGIIQITTQHPGGRYRDAIVGMASPNGRLVISGIEKQFAPRISALFGDLSLITRRRMGDWHAYLFQIDKPAQLR